MQGGGSQQRPPSSTASCGSALCRRRCVAPGAPLGRLAIALTTPKSGQGRPSLIEDTVISSVPTLALPTRCLLLRNPDPRRPNTHHGISPNPAQAAPESDSQAFGDSPATGTKYGKAARSEFSEGKPLSAAPLRDGGLEEVGTEVEAAGGRGGKHSDAPCVQSPCHAIINRGTPSVPERGFTEGFAQGGGTRMRRGCESGVGVMGTTRRPRQVIFFAPPAAVLLCLAGPFTT